MSGCVMSPYLNSQFSMQVVFKYLVNILDFIFYYRVLINFAPIFTSCSLPNDHSSYSFICRRDIVVPSFIVLFVVTFNNPLIRFILCASNT